MTCTKLIARDLLRDLVTDPVSPNEFPTQHFERSRFNRFSRLTHQIEIEMQVVQRNQAQSENFLRLDQVPNVAARKFRADRTGAALLDRTFLQRELGVL